MLDLDYIYKRGDGEFVLGIIMKIKFKQIIIGISLAAILLAGYIIHKQMKEHNDPFETAACSAYIADVLPRYFISDRDNDHSNVQISQGYVINNGDDNARVYFVTSEMECIGLLIVSSTDGVFHSSYGPEDNAIINDAIKNSTPFALFVVPTGTLLIQTEQGNFLLSPFGNPEELPKHFPTELETEYQKFEIMLGEINSSN